MHHASKTWAERIGTEAISAIFTWLLVAGSALTLSFGFASVSLFQWNLALIFYLVFIAGFLAAVRDAPYRHDSAVRAILLFIQLAAVIGVYVCLPFSYNGILMTIWSGQIIYFMAFRKAIMLSVFWSAPLWITQDFIWHQQGAWLTAILFWTFNLFALVMVNSRLKEEQANAKAQALNRELMATQVLLESAAKDAERTRIARNIHDLLGHHLTALTIHLQVVERQLEGDLKEKVSNCHQIAKLLLSDVREAVSEIRDQEGIDIKSALETLTANVPETEVTLELSAVPELTVEQADAVVRAVQETLTNIMRHSNAKALAIVLSADESDITLTMSDNGRDVSTPVPGNGLTGMQERILTLGGTMAINATATGLHTHITLPRAC
ncbi:sensor histidine kinase [Alteromonas antoniana]|uniref:sensor histidine kinase n=1 Tax=Alteromonas antoniana TaxID=2803813 RepID=UPI001C48D969|nr:sensor histidine kinase [Alteromonas antoniana]